jgi:hypothetical protein
LDEPIPQQLPYRFTENRSALQPHFGMAADRAAILTSAKESVDGQLEIPLVDIVPADKIAFRHFRGKLGRRADPALAGLRVLIGLNENPLLKPTSLMLCFGHAGRSLSTHRSC